METDFTPLKSSNERCNNNNENHACYGTCSICLSPLKTPSGSITTKCNVSNITLSILL